MEYIQSKAENLNKFNIQEFEMPAGIKILWLDILDTKNSDKPFSAGVHTHSFWELHFIFSGKVYYECCESVLEISQNQVILIPPYVKHRFLKSDNMIKTALAFDFADCDFLKQNSECMKIQVFDFGDDIYENIKAVLKYCEKDDIFIKDILKSRVIEIIYSVFEMLKVDLPKATELESDLRVKLAKKYIEYNKHRIITAEEVARECYISSKQLNRLFKMNIGKTIFQYITEIKTEYAKELLEKSDFNIKEIAVMLGFENESGFYVFFKRHCKMTPRAYRMKKVNKGTGYYGG